jgi:phage-related protein
MGISYDLESVMKGDVTAAQFQETYKQQVQDGLDAYFN